MIHRHMESIREGRIECTTDYLEELKKIGGFTMATTLRTNSRDWMFSGPTTSPLPEKVKISKVHNGFIVEVGCVTAVFNTDKEMMKELNLYWKDPVKAEEEWTKKQ